MWRSLVVALILVVATVGCGGDAEPPSPVDIAYQYRLNDDRDSVSTEMAEGHYEVRVNGDCSEYPLKFTQGGFFDDEFDVDRLVEIGLDIEGTSRWRIRQHDGDEMADCEGLTLYPEGVDPPAIAATTVTSAAPTTTEAAPKPKVTTTTTAPPTTTTTNPLDDMTQAQRDAFNRFLNPPPPPPPAAAPSGCDPNYSGCVPIASDVDCAGGSGDGPAYTGYARVIGSDIYDLDSDGDGVACE